MIRATLLGNGGSKPTLKRRLTSLYLNVEGDGVLIDCGEGTQVSFADAKENILSISVICLTHNHADHIFGLPGLLTSLDQSVKLAKRSEKKDIILIGPKSCKSFILGLEKMVRLNHLNLFFVVTDDSACRFEFEKFVVTSYRLQHSTECYGYRIEQRTNPHFCREKATNCPLDSSAWVFLQEGYKITCSGKDYGIDAITERENKGSCVAYATDTSLCSNVVKCAENADLAVLEGMYFSENERASSIDSKHMTFEDAAKAAKDANAGELWLTHFSPAMPSPSLGLENATKYFENTKCGRGGLSMEV